MSLTEQIYRRARAAYERHQHRDCLKLLDPNWKQLEEYAKSNGLFQQLLEMRNSCRDAIISQLDGPPPKTPAIRRNTRKLTRVKRERRR